MADHSFSSVGTSAIVAEGSRGRAHPISRFPSELLRIIFTFYVLEVAPPGTRLLNRDWGMLYPSWIGITYVCRRWRALSLSTSELWRHITLNLSVKWASVLTERSYPQPIILELSVRNIELKTSIAALHELIGDGSRVEELYVAGKPADLSPLLEKTRIGARLRSLTVDLPDLSGNGREHSSVFVTDHSFHGGTPILTRVELAPGVNVHPSFFSNLLAITDLTMTSSLPIDELMPALMTLRNLSTLRLRGVLERGNGLNNGLLDEPETVDLPPLPSISLPSLAYLSVSGPFHYVSGFCPRLRIPPTATSELLIEDYDRGFGDESSWDALLRPFPGHLSGQPLPLLAVHVEEGAGSAKLYGWTGSVPAFPACALETAQFVLHLAWGSHSRRGRQCTPSPFWFPCVFAHLSLLDTHTLSIATDPRVIAAEDEISTSVYPEIPTSWSDLLQSMPGVEDLILRRNTKSLLRVVKRPGATLVAQLSAPVLLPRLRRLVIMKESVISWLDESDLSGVFTCLQEFIKESMQDRPQLKRLELHDCIVPPDDVRSLRMLVETVNQIVTPGWEYDPLF